MTPHLSFIIPAFNEESRIGKSLETALEYFKGQPYTFEIVVVDDGSSDNTIQVAERYENVRVIQQPGNIGKGAAVRVGMLSGAGTYRIFSDADLSTPIYETAVVLKSLEAGADICIGSRAIDRSFIKKRQPWYRETMGKVYNLIVQILVMRGIKDTQCGFKGFTAHAAEAVFSIAKIDGFSFDVEALYLARNMGLRIEQEPVEWYNDDRSTLHPIYDSLQMIIEILKIRRLHRHV